MQSRIPAYTMRCSRDVCLIPIGEMMKSMMRAAAVFAMTCTWLVVGMADDRAPEAGAVGTQQRNEVSIPRGGDFIVVPVRFPDRTCLFLVDTGKPFGICVDDRHRDLLGDRIESTADANYCLSKAPCYPLQSFFIGEFEFEFHAICSDLKSLQQDTGYDIDGILGAYFVAAFPAMQIDFDRGRLSMTFERMHEGAKLAFVDGGHAIEATLGQSNVPMQFLIDTGSRTSLKLNSKVYDQLVKSGDIHPARNEFSADFSGQHDYGRISAIRMAGMTIQDIGVRRGDRNSVGLELLSRLRVKMDYMTDFFSLAPGARLNQPDTAPWAGLQVRKVAGNFVVSQLMHHGPADVAGLRTEHILLSIGDQKLNHLSVFEVENHDAWNAARVQIRFRRGRAEYRADVVRPIANRQ